MGVLYFLKATISLFASLTLAVGLINCQSPASSDLQCKQSNKDGKVHVSCVQYPEIPTDLQSKYSFAISEVQVLDMSSGNHLQIIKEAEFTSVGLDNLQTITLSNNNIRRLERGAFRNLERLVEIDLSSNKIDSLDMEMFETNDQLKILKLNKNPIHAFLGTKFPPLPSLRTLDLSDCEIKKIPKDSFHELSNLEELILRGNNITRLDWEVFESLRKLTTIALLNNPWECDCHLRFLREFLLHQIQRLDSKLICTGPGKMANRLWNSIDSDELMCHPQIPILKVISHNRNESYSDDETVYSEIGKDIAFECVIESYPAPEVTWKKDDKPVLNYTISSIYRILDDEEEQESRMTIRYLDPIKTPSNYTYQYTSLLKIYRSEAKDLGKYSCYVNNKAGEEFKSIFLNFTNLPLIEDNEVPLKAGWKLSKIWLWIVLALVILILIALLVLCFGIWRRRQYKKQKVLKKNMMEKFKNSQTILDDSSDAQHMQITQISASAPLLQISTNSKSSLEKLRLPEIAQGSTTYNRSLSPEVFSPRPPSTADMKRQFFANRQMSEPPTTSSRPGSAMSLSNYPDYHARRFQFAQQQYPGSEDRYYTIRRPGSSLSLVYPDPSYRPQQRPQFTRQHSGPALPSYATMRSARDRRPPSVSSFTSEVSQHNYRPGFGYMTLPRNFVPPRGDSGFGRSLSPTESSYSTLSYSTLPRNGRMDGNSRVVYDAVGPRTSIDGGSNLSLNRIGQPTPSNDALDSINQGLFSPSRGKVKSGRNRTGSSTTPGSLRGRNDFFSFEPIQEVDGSEDVLTNLPSNIEMDQLLQELKSKQKPSEQRFAKKKAPAITNIPPKSRKPIRTFEYSKYPDKQNQVELHPDNHNHPTSGSGHGIVIESSIDDPYDVNFKSLSNKIPKLPPTAPPKPNRLLQSSIENIFDSDFRLPVLQEVPGTEV